MNTYKKKQMEKFELKYTVSKMKIPLYKFNNRLDIEEKRISELKKMPVNM